MQAYKYAHQQSLHPLSLALALRGCHGGAYRRQDSASLASYWPSCTSE